MDQEIYLRLVFGSTVFNQMLMRRRLWFDLLWLIEIIYCFTEGNYTFKNVKRKYLNMFRVLFSCVLLAAGDVLSFYASLFRDGDLQAVALDVGPCAALLPRFYLNNCANIILKNNIYICVFFLLWTEGKKLQFDFLDQLKLILDFLTRFK